MNKVTVLIEGYAKWIEAHKQAACGTITLVRGHLNNCIVDTGNVETRKRFVRR